MLPWSSSSWSPTCFWWQCQASTCPFIPPLLHLISLPVIPGPETSSTPPGHRRTFARAQTLMPPSRSLTRKCCSSRAPTCGSLICWTTKSASRWTTASSSPASVTGKQKASPKQEATLVKVRATPNRNSNSSRRRCSRTTSGTNTKSCASTVTESACKGYVNEHSMSFFTPACHCRRRFSSCSGSTLISLSLAHVFFAHCFVVLQHSLLLFHHFT